jgi:hypothetical protein
MCNFAENDQIPRSAEIFYVTWQRKSMWMRHLMTGCAGSNLIRTYKELWNVYIHPPLNAHRKRKLWGNDLKKEKGKVNGEKRQAASRSRHALRWKSGYCSDELWAQLFSWDMAAEDKKISKARVIVKRHHESGRMLSSSEVLEDRRINSLPQEGTLVPPYGNLLFPSSSTSTTAFCSGTTQFH